MYLPASSATASAQATSNPSSSVNNSSLLTGLLANRRCGSRGSSLIAEEVSPPHYSIEFNADTAWAQVAVIGGNTATGCDLDSLGTSLHRLPLGSLAGTSGSHLPHKRRCQLRSHEGGADTRCLSLSDSKGPRRSSTDGGQCVANFRFRNVLARASALLRCLPRQIGERDHPYQRSLRVDHG